MCDNCYHNVGPFYIVYTPPAGRAFRVCGPITYDEKGKLTLRSAECADRRKKLETKWYGQEDYRS
jgi:hypothetical protein